MPHLTLEEYMSWVPLAGSAVGTVMGGLLADRLLSPLQPSTTRMFICSIGCFIATPLVIMSLFLPVPACFLVLVGSGLVGEVYLGQSLAVISELSPQENVVSSGSFYLKVN